MLYRFDNIEKSYGPHDIVKGATWQHNPGEKVGLVGRNRERLARRGATLPLPRSAYQSWWGLVHILWRLAAGPGYRVGDIESCGR